jgi:signal transduction histidine kinase
MAAVAVVRLFHHYFRDTPLWLAAMAVPAVLWLTVLQTSFVLHYCNRSQPRLERGLAIYAFGGSAMLLVAAVTDLFSEATQVIYASLAILTPILGAIIIYQLSREPSRGNILMMVAMLLNVAFGIHDFLNYQELLGYDRLYLLPLGLPLLLLAVAALLARRFVETLNDYETLNTSLSVRIAGRERELAASFARERELDQQRATADERQKLMRDMHDGLGSHLMSTLALLKRGSLQQSEVESLLTDCIDELKLTIDSLEPVERDLAVVLGNLRYRLEPRLNAAGISLDWAVTDLPPLDYLDPENVRSILRIVQEAFTNTLKHANASRIMLSTGTNRAANRVWVRVTDDGRHFDTEKAKGGRGLANMHSRAARMQGEIEVVALKGGGTCVNLLLPIQKQKPPIDGLLQLFSSENARQF